MATRCVKIQTKNILRGRGSHAMHLERQLLSVSRASVAGRGLLHSCIRGEMLLHSEKSTTTLRAAIGSSWTQRTAPNSAWASAGPAPAPARKRVLQRAPASCHSPQKPC